MIISVLYNKVPNNQTGQMGYTERTVGVWYGNVMCESIVSGYDPLTHEAIIAISFSDGKTQVIPYKDTEIIYATDTKDNTGAASEDDDTVRK